MKTPGDNDMTNGTDEYVQVFETPCLTQAEYDTLAATAPGSPPDLSQVKSFNATLHLEDVDNNEDDTLMTLSLTINLDGFSLLGGQYCKEVCASTTRTVDSTDQEDQEGGVPSDDSDNGSGEEFLVSTEPGSMAPHFQQTGAGCVPVRNTTGGRCHSGQVCESFPSIPALLLTIQDLPAGLRTSDSFLVRRGRADVRVTLSRARTIRGEVGHGWRRWLPPAAVAELEARAQWRSTAPDDPGTARASVSEDGTFMLTGIPEGVASLVWLDQQSTLAFGLGCESVEVDPYNRGAVRLHVEPLPPVSGVIQREALSGDLEQWPVELHHELDPIPRNTMHSIVEGVDDRSHFSFEGVPPGRYTLLLRAESELKKLEATARRVVALKHGVTPGQVGLRIGRAALPRAVVLRVTGTRAGRWVRISVHHRYHVIWTARVVVPLGSEEVVVPLLLPAGVTECEVIVRDAGKMVARELLRQGVSRMALRLRAGKSVSGRIDVALQSPRPMVLLRSPHARSWEAYVAGDTFWFPGWVPPGSYDLELWDLGQRSDRLSQWIEPTCYRREYVVKDVVAGTRDVILSE